MKTKKIRLLTTRKVGFIKFKLKSGKRKLMMLLQRWNYLSIKLTSIKASLIKKGYGASKKTLSCSRLFRKEEKQVRFWTQELINKMHRWRWRKNTFQTKFIFWNSSLMKIRNCMITWFRHLSVRVVIVM